MTVDDGYGVSFGGNENVLKLHSHDGCISLWILLKNTELFVLGWIL